MSGALYTPRLAPLQASTRLLSFANHDTIQSQGADPLPLPLRVAKAVRNHLNEEITPLLRTGIGERCSRTISNLGHAHCNPFRLN